MGWKKGEKKEKKTAAKGGRRKSEREKRERKNDQAWVGRCTSLLVGKS